MSRLKDQNTPEFDPYRRFVEATPMLVTLARSATREDASSYRDFNVGVSLYAVDSDNKLGIYTAGNLKPRSSRTKVCAEKLALNKAQKAGFEYVVGMVVGATTDVQKIREVTNAETPTLHCCGDCLGMFSHHPLMRDETIIVSAGLENDKYQAMTASEMSAMYTVDPAAIPEQPSRFGFEDWSAHVDAYDKLVYDQRGEQSLSRQQSAMLAKIAILYSVTQ